MDIMIGGGSADMRKLHATLTSHLHALHVPQVLYCHLQNVRFLQLGVSGALQEAQTCQSPAKP